MTNSPPLFNRCASGVGMTLLSINEPTAYTIGNLEALQNHKDIKKVETNNGVIVLYMDEVGRNCFFIGLTIIYLFILVDRRSLFI